MAVPLMLLGERSSTGEEPARSLYTALSGQERPGVWRTDLMIGHVWAVEPCATARAVVTDTDRDAAEAAALRSASDFWAARDVFRFGPMTGALEVMIDIPQPCRTRPVILAYSGVNPTGCGVGDRADGPAALIARDRQEEIVAGITDRPASDACFCAGPGVRFTLRVGASLDPSVVAVTAETEVLALDEGPTPADRQAVVFTGEVTVVLAARRRAYHTVADFARLGHDPAHARLVVVKTGCLSPELAPRADSNPMDLKKGVVNQDIERLANLHCPPGTLPFRRRDCFDPVAEPSLRVKNR